jgi:PAS domain S-box-containing protein
MDPRIGKGVEAAKEQHLMTEWADLEQLHALSMRLIGQSDLATMLHEILTAVAALLQTGKANIQIYKGQDHALKLISVIGLDQNFTTLFSSAAARRVTICAAVLQRGERVIIEDLSTHPDFTEFARLVLPYDIRAAQATPLFGSDGQISGILTTYFNQPHHPSEHELQLLDLYAQQAARQIERAESEERLRQSEARLAMELVGAQQLQEISTQLIQSNDITSLYQRILDAIITIMDAKAASLQILYPEKGKLRLLAWIGFDPASAAHWEWVSVDSGSCCSAALKTGQRVIVPDIEKCDFIIGTPSFDSYCQSGIRAVQSTPLLSRTGCMLGMISTYWHEPHQPTKHSLRLLDVLARQAADLIERTQTEERLRQAKEQLDMALSAGKLGHWQLDLADLSLTPSSQCLANFGRTADEAFTYEIFRNAIHPDDRARVESAVDRAIQKCSNYEADYRCLWPNGSTHWLNDRGRVISNKSDRASCRKMIGVTLDITERKQTEALLVGQKQVLEMLATDVALAEVLAALIRVIEGQSAGLIGSILIRQPDNNCLYMGVAPSLPASYTEALQQTLISSPYLGPCGRVIHLGEAISVADIAADQRWSKEWRDLVLGLGLRACHSSPILASDGKVLGAFCLYYRKEPCNLKPQNAPLLEIATHLAGIAIERWQSREFQQKAGRRKDEFLAMLAHELRNPLTPILNVVQLLHLAGDNKKMIQSASEIIERQINLMVRLVDDLLDVSRITRGKIKLRQKRVELAFAVDQAIETTRPLLQSLGHELTVILPPQPVYVYGDLVRLTQIISNLLNNACKFTGQGGQIWLTVEDEGEWAAIRVRDTGIGITADQLFHIFEPFMQVDTSLERTQSGLGIGLTLVKNLTEMHGGRVEVHSDGYGRGSEFVVRLPLLAATPQLPPEQTLVKPVAKTGYRILVVDDNQDAVTSLATWLELIGHEIQIAHDGLAALEAAVAFKPDVLLLDIGLPKMNGYDVARKVREQPWGEKMVLVAITGWGQDKDREKSREAGFNHHMVKPIDHAALTRILAKLGSR